MRIFLDLDGVLVNWSGGLCNLLGIDPYCKEAQEILSSDKPIEGWKFGSKDDVENAVLSAGYDFWINLETLPWAERLIQLCAKYGEVYFLTSPHIFHAGAHAKFDYIYDNFNSTNIAITKHKYLCAKPNHILIDDYIKNLDEWEKESGTGFKWPCQWQLRKDPELLEETFSKLEGLLAIKKVTYLP